MTPPDLDQRHEADHTPYGRFAAAYAAGAERQFSEAMAGFVLETLGARLPSQASVADVACGMGAACEYFAARGLRVYGVDASADMLRRARAAGPAGEQAAGEQAVVYLQQDMRELDLPERVDVITCMYDSLNFMLTTADLRRAFAAARKALRDGGHYVFDVYTPNGLSRLWGSQDEVHTVHPDHFVATRTRWDPISGTDTKTLWGFDRENGAWRHWEERHTARGYSAQEIQDALAGTGFEVRGTYEWRPSAGATPAVAASVARDADRLVFVATAR